MSINNKLKIDETSYDVDDFYSKCNFLTFDYCINWIGPINPGGYGVYNYRGKKYVAHRISYFINYSSIDADMVIDHICKNRKCIHPEHLRQVTQTTNASENTDSKTSECGKGHLYNEENTYYESSGAYRHKRCRKCKKEKSKRDYQAAKQRKHTRASESSKEVFAFSVRSGVLGLVK